MKIEVEILRTVTITRDEAAVVEVDIPKSIPEEEREDWILDQLSEGHLKIGDERFDVNDEQESTEYQEVNEV